MSQPFYKKAGVQAAFVSGLFLLVIAIITFFHTKKTEPSITINQTATQSPNSTQIAAKQVVINQSDEEKIRSEMKDRIRAVLGDVNPDILSAIDSGTSQMRVFISEVKLRRLERLMEFPEFKKYIKILSSDQVQFAGNNNYFGEGTYDTVRSGNIYCEAIIINDELRNSK